MTKTDKPMKAIRYRIHFWLMDIAALAVVLTLGLPALDSLSGLDIRSVMPAPVWVGLYAFALIFGLVVPTFLMCARFIRDDYVVGLWQPSVAAPAYVMAFIPIAFLSVSRMIYLTLGQSERAPDFIRWTLEKLEIGRFIVNLFGSYVMIFVAIFQFLRWRDAQ